MESHSVPGNANDLLSATEIQNAWTFVYQCLTLCLKGQILFHTLSLLLNNTNLVSNN